MHASRFSVPALLFLAACSGPPQPETEESSFDPGPDCQEACASGYHWAVERELPNKAKCRGDNDFARGCEKAVEDMNPTGE